jgi:hypothetical protein
LGSEEYGKKGDRNRLTGRETERDRYKVKGEDKDEKKGDKKRNKVVDNYKKWNNDKKEKGK